MRGKQRAKQRAKHQSKTQSKTPLRKRHSKTASKHRAKHRSKRRGKHRGKTSAKTPQQNAKTLISKEESSATADSAGWQPLPMAHIFLHERTYIYMSLQPAPQGAMPASGFPIRTLLQVYTAKFSALFPVFRMGKFKGARQQQPFAGVNASRRSPRRRCGLCRRRRHW